MGTPQRKRNRQLAEKNKAVAVYDKSDAESDTESQAEFQTEPQAPSHAVPADASPKPAADHLS